MMIIATIAKERDERGHRDERGYRDVRDDRGRDDRDRGIKLMIWYIINIHI